MSERDIFRKIQTALGVDPTGIPNDATKVAWQTHWDAALAEYRGEAGTPSQPAQPTPPAPIARFVIQDDWLVGVKRVPFLGGSTIKPQCVVEHFTAGADGQSSINYWRELNNGVCAHLVIDRDGTVIQCRPFTKSCGHAGESQWVNPRTGQRFSGLNQYSIGIEIANAGDDDVAWAKKQPGYVELKARHRNGGQATTWEAYPPKQIASVTAVTKALVDHYGLDDVTGHDCIAPRRKNDPGPAFPMEEVRKACGFSGLPAVHGV